MNLRSKKNLLTYLTQKISIDFQPFKKLNVRFSFSLFEKFATLRINTLRVVYEGLPFENWHVTC